jgi:hypothetical protein
MSAAAAPPPRAPRSLPTYAVLTGLTPLIPLPYIDDLVKAYFRRRLVRTLAQEHRVALSNEAVRALADESNFGCLAGCLVAAFVYPLKKIFRKIFFFLEWKRAVDTASRTYYTGFLLHHAFASGAVAPAGPHAPEHVRSALESVLRQIGTGLVERAVRETFKKSSGTLKDAARVIQSALRGRGGRPSADEVGDVLESIDAEEKRRVEGVAGRLGDALDKIPAAHFEYVRALFDAELVRPPAVE